MLNPMADNHASKKLSDYNALINDLRQNRADILSNKASDLIQYLDMADANFKNVQNTHDATLDAKTLSVATDIAVEKVLSSNGSFLYTSDDFIGCVQSIYNRLETDQIDDLLECWNGVDTPDTVFFNFEGRKRNPRKPTTRIGDDPLRVVGSNKQEVEEVEDDTSHLVMKVYQTLQKYKKINFYEFVINPTSFPKTIEAIFYTSFLVFDLKAKIYKDASGEPILELMEECDSDVANKPHKIIPFDMATWKRLIAKYKITKHLINL